MQMEIILLENITGLGRLGDLVRVKAGYARNFLLPSGKAVRATKENKEDFEKRREALENQARERLLSARNRAASLTEIELTLTAKAGEEGKLFGSIGVRDLSEAVGSAGVEVHKSEIRMPAGPIRRTGEYDIDVQLHPEVKTSIKVFVEAE